MSDAASEIDNGQCTRAIDERCFLKTFALEVFSAFRYVVGNLDLAALAGLSRDAFGYEG